MLFDLTKKKKMRPTVPFYFLRHAETNHNLHKIYDDSSDVEINENGIMQAQNIKEVLDACQITTVCCSPLRRAQETKQIVMSQRQYSDVMLEELEECSSKQWRIFIAAESRPLHPDEELEIEPFLGSTRVWLEKIATLAPPVLVVAHGGTYWALNYLLQIGGDRRIGNCCLIKINPPAGAAEVQANMQSREEYVIERFNYN